MKPLIHKAIAILMLLLPMTMFAQGPACRLGGEKEFIELLRRNMDTIQRMEGVFQRQMDARKTNMVNLPIQFHVVRSSTGQTDVTTATIERSVVILNEYFANAGLRFFQCSGVKYIDDSNLRNFFISQQSALVARSYVDKVINIYCVPAIEGGAVGGYTYLPGSRQPDLIVMDDGFLTTTTLTHEMGHFFGLLHSHGSSNCPSSMPGTDELVDGSNCSTAGDYICDTPADPGLLGAGCSQFQVDASCNYIGTSRDARGMAFAPDVNNIMSYSRSSCRSRLSAGQYSRINATYLRFRTYLACRDSVGPVVAGAPFLSMESPVFLQPNPVRAGAPFTLSVQLKNTGTAGFRGRIRMVLFNRLDQQIGTIGTTALTDSLRSGAITQLLPFSNPGILLDPETYKVGVYFQTDTLQPYQLAGSEKFSALFSFTVAGAPMNCVAANNVRLTDAGLSHLIFSWDPSPVTGAYYKISYREKDKPNWVEISNWSATRVIILNRKPCTPYEFRIKTVCSSGETDWTNTLNATTNGCNDNYCVSYGNSMRTFIEEVRIGSIRNTSGNNYGYGNYTQVRRSVSPGTTESIQLVPGMAPGEVFRPVFWQVWADFNRDGDFFDAGEQLFQGSDQNNRSLSATIQIPANAVAGDIRMRVSVDTREFPTPCAVNDYREVEDYTLVVSGATASINLSTSQMEFNQQGTAQSLAVQSSGPWSASSAAAWVNFQPSSGNGGTSQVSLSCAPNTSLQSRQATVQFQSGSARAELTVTQRGALTSVSNVAFQASGGTQSFLINADGPVNFVKKPDWVSLNLANAAQGQTGMLLTLICTPNPREISRVDTLRITWPSGVTASVLVTQAANALPSAWNWAPTTRKHLVVLSDKLTGDLNGLPLVPGDYIGVFYSDSTQERCAGAALWSGETGLLTVSGDNPLTLLKDGMANDEAFKVRVWKLSNQTEYRVNATYANPVPGGVPSHTNRFALNGVSRMESLSSGAAFRFTLTLNAGFNMISFPVIPESANPFNIFAPAGSAMRELQTASGARVNFVTRLNEVGNLSPKNGYIAFTEKAVTVDIRGEKILPSAQPIILDAGWHIIPFWSLKSRPAAEALASLNGSLLIAKDMDGKAYSPAYNINTLGTLNPGKAYWAYLAKRDTLVFPDAYMQESTNFDEILESQHQRTRQFSLSPVKNPVVNATIIIPAEGIDHLLEQGDEVGIFSPAGKLYGSAVFRGKNLAVTVWDMPQGSPYIFRIWKMSTGEVQSVNPVFAERTPRTFSILGLTELSRLELAREATSLTAAGDWTIYPNPAVKGTTLQLERKSATPAIGLLINAQGTIVREWVISGDGLQELNLPEVAPGMYFLQIADKSGIQRKPLIIHH